MHASMLVVVGALASLNAVVVNADTIKVKAGQQNVNSISKAIRTAPADSVLELYEGDYYQTDMLVIDKPLMIQGAGKELTRIHLNSLTVPVLLYATTFNSVLTDFSIVDSLPENPTTCAPVDTLPSEQLEIFDPPSTALLDGTLRITGTLGQWPNMFTATHMGVGDCDYGVGSEHLSRPFFELVSNTCEYNFGISVQRQSLDACGVQVTQEGNGTVSTYGGVVQIKTVAMVNSLPTTTTHIGVLEAEFSENGNGGSVASEDTHVRAVLTLIELGEVNENTSYIELSLTMPSEFHVPSNATGPVDAAMRLDDELSTTAWFPISECAAFDGSSEEGSNATYCRQTIGFQVTACDVSAHYHIDELPVECKDAAVCGADPGYKASLNFVVDATQLCAASESADIELNLPIESIVTEMRSSDFEHALGATGLIMGKTSYWMIEMDTGTTGLIIDQAELVAISRNVTGRDCTPYEFYRNVGTIAQRYLPPIGEAKGRLQIELPVDQAMACDDGSEVLADSDVALTFTYLVSYQDYVVEEGAEEALDEELSVADRRRSERSRRESGQLSAEAVTHVRRAAAKQVFAAPKIQLVGETPVMFEMDSADTVSVVAGMSALLLIAGLTGAGLWYGFKKIAEKSKTLKAQKYENIGDYQDARGDENFSSMYEYNNAYQRDGNGEDMTEVLPNRPSFFDGGSQYDSNSSSKNKGAATSL
ncbi:hypothetical protein SARC_11392 [Sphaeroforma arctica JP610]|uniref:Peptidase A1 domain-containing protein n=1 Tax=Sphaeroforma arctica JP610 TaxID=667725 RepID=A0A0L0FJB8_9EUKA|nr:hypothetical protein SARC_11392 [Sphaeroforma arctica JP610]KNC76098.1 hypothetical protein SARC_11392 [Sphaeroforma arctica JP610]|eukprot:XP_014150000.1 hypothetical protein SARC_11392 [Sphaeroforma arctica JP610]